MPDETSTTEVEANFPEYNVRRLETAAAKHIGPQGFSQKREAEKARELIDHLLSANPNLTGPAMAALLKEHRKAGAESLGPSFRRAVGSIVREIKAGRRSGRATHTGAVRSRTVTPATSIVGASGATPTAIVPGGDRPRSAPASAARPYKLDGAFRGLVFKSGPTLRRFFTAVQADAPMEDLAALANESLPTMRRARRLSTSRITTA